MVNTIYFLGAGVSKETGAPTQKELWEEAIALWKRINDQKIKEVLDFGLYVNFGRDIDDIKVDFGELLTLIDLALEQDATLGAYNGNKLRQLRSNVVYTICKSLEHSIKPVKNDALDRFVKLLTPNDTIISLNYDTVIDNMIFDNFGKVSYGFVFSSIFSEDWEQEGSPGQLLLKPHGSLNWFYCKRCNNIYMAPKKYVQCSQKELLCLTDDYPLHEVIVSPSYHKRFLVPQLHDVWMQCFYQIKNADVINFMGYSFPPADIHITYLIKRAILARGKIPRINVVTRDSQGIVLERCNQTFADFNYFNTTFSDYMLKYT